MAFKLFFVVCVIFVTIYLVDAGFKRHKLFKTYQCEGRRVKMTCLKDRIVVIKADYGRWNETICPYYDDPDMNLDCHQPEAFDKVSKKCNGQGSCFFNADNDFFSDPCPGQVKYSVIYYTCLSKWDMMGYKFLPKAEREDFIKSYFPKFQNRS